jgi:LDH2 family malate/lactate/ureidoglycolate dehydrogenase
VLSPGEVERETRRSGSSKAIALDDKTWADIVAAAQSVGIDAHA